MPFRVSNSGWLHGQPLPSGKHHAKNLLKPYDISYLSSSVLKTESVDEEYMNYFYMLQFPHIETVALYYSSDMLPFTFSNS